MKTFKYLPQIL